MHKNKPIIGVMGGAVVSKDVFKDAYQLGALIARQGWVLLCGGRDAGVMRAAAQGARSENGLTIGILPGADKNQANPFIDVAIVTDMGDARNNINVLSSDIIVACPGGDGTFSEIALALKKNKTVIQLGEYFSIPFQQALAEKHMLTAMTPIQCIELIKKLLC